MVVALVLLFLISDVRAHYLLVQSYRGDKVTSGPEVLAREIPLSAPKLARNLDRAFALDVPDHVRHRVFRRDAQAHVNVIAHQMPLHDLRRLVLDQLVEQLPKVPTQHTEDPLLPSLRNENHVVLAVPSRVTQALILIHRELTFSWQRLEIHSDRRIGQTLVSPPAKPGAYLAELTCPHRQLSRRTPIATNCNFVQIAQFPT